MKLLLTSIFLIALSASVSAQSKFGSLAIDRNNGFYYGFAYDHATQAEADARALQECRSRGGQCAVVVWWSGAGCAAYRTVEGNVGTAYGWGIAVTKEQADAIATRECRQRSNGRSATNFAWACNSGDAPLQSRAPETTSDAPPAEAPQGSIVFNGNRIAASGDCPTGGVAMVTADDESVMVMFNNVPSSGNVSVNADFYTSGCTSCPAIQVQDMASSTIYVATGGSFSKSGTKVSFQLTVKELGELIAGGASGVSVSGSFDCEE